MNQILSQGTINIHKEMESKITRNLERLAWQLGNKEELYEKENKSRGMVIMEEDLDERGSCHLLQKYYCSDKCQLCSATKRC